MAAQITPFTTTPNRKNPATFSEDMDTRLAEEDSRIAEMNAMSTELNDLSVDVNNKATSASQSASEAAQSSLIAQGSANFKGDWNSATAYKIGESSYKDGNFYVALQDNTNQDPTITNGYWRVNVPMGAFGRLSSPLLDLPLKNSLAMKAGVGSVTFTRSTTATYIDRYGVLQTAAIDEPRFEKDGLLIEGASTNLVLSSEVADNAIACSITADATEAPDGSITADLITADGTDAQHYVQKIVTVADDSSTYTCSVFVKNGSSDYIRFSQHIIGGSTNVLNSTLFTFSTETATNGAKVEKLDNGWYRLSQQITNNSLGNTSLYNRVYTEDWIANTSTNTIYVWGMQSEQLPFASSYIPTTTSAVTRSNDNNYATFKNNVMEKEGSLLIEINDFSDQLGNYHMLFKTDVNNFLYSYISASTGYVAAICPYGAISVPSGSFNNGGTLIITWKAGEQKAYIDGIQVCVNSTTQIAYPYVGNTKIYIGNRDSLYADTNTHQVKNFKIFDVCLTDTEAMLLGGK